MSQGIVASVYVSKSFLGMLVSTSGFTMGILAIKHPNPPSNSLLHADPRQVGHSFVDQRRRLQRQGELRLRSHGRLQSQGSVPRKACSCKGSLYWHIEKGSF